jgi:hypothetical protein
VFYLSWLLRSVIRLSVSSLTMPSLNFPGARFRTGTAIFLFTVPSRTTLRPTHPPVGLSPPGCSTLRPLHVSITRCSGNSATQSFSFSDIVLSRTNELGLSKVKPQNITSASFNRSLWLNFLLVCSHQQLPYFRWLKPIIQPISSVSVILLIFSQRWLLGLVSSGAMTPCRVGRYQRIVGTCCFHLSTLKMEAAWSSPTRLRIWKAKKIPFWIVETN